MLKVHKNIWLFLLQFVFKQRLIFLFLGIVSIILNVCNNLVWPAITGNLVDILSSIDDRKKGLIELVGMPLIVALAFWALIELTQRLKGLILAFAMPKFEAAIRMNIFSHVIQHSHSFFIDKHKGAIANRISDMPKSARVIVDDCITVFIPLIISIIISSCAYFTLHPMLALIIFSWLIMHFGLALFFGIKAAHHSSAQSAIRSLVQGKIVDSITNHFIVKTFNRVNYEIEDAQKVQTNEIKKYIFSLLYIEKFKLLLSVVGIVFATLLFTYAFQLWANEQLTTGEIAFILTNILNLLLNLWYVGDEMSYVFYELGVCKQSLVLTQEPVESAQYIADSELKVQNGDIEFDNVTFCYSDNNNLFENKSLSIKGKQKVGLVGFSGSGKSTFANLIMKLYAASSGTIRIDGQDIAKVSLASLRSQIALIPQESMLFHRSVIENIQYGKIKATREEVIAAATKAGCHEFIVHLEHGYDTIVGEMGGKLSGGQRQRISIARAILKNAPIIIMDEATSNLDTVTEQLITRSINDFMKNKTVIVIAHKLSTLLNMDRILVFDKGRVIEDGSHKELLSRGGHYALLWNMQSEGILPEHD